MNDSRHYKPELLFLVHTSLDANALCELYKANHNDDMEPELWPLNSLASVPFPVTCVLRAGAECAEQLDSNVAPEPAFGELPEEPQATATAPEGAAAGAAAAGADRRGGMTYVVVGGTAEKGIVVRQGPTLTSPEMPRLARGARVEEVERNGVRLHFKKLEGEGPESG